VWKDSTLLPTIDEFQRERRIVASALRAAANATAAARHPGQGWQSGGLLAAMEGGNALYRLQKLLAEPVAAWTHDFAQEFGAAASGDSDGAGAGAASAAGEQGGDAAPDWVQDRSQQLPLLLLRRRRLLVAAADGLGGQHAQAATEGGLLALLPPGFVSGFVTAVVVLQLLAVAKQRAAPGAAAADS
jgi:hypothetical protein